jgi:isopentenyldiphosphate isomerase
MSQESIDIYNDNMQYLGVMTRSEAETTGQWHKSIHCWVVRPADDGYVLFQKRGRDKTVFPNALDITAAGHYKAGEKKEDGVREIVEELGVPVAFHQLIPLGVKQDVGRLGPITNREFCDVYLLLRNELPKEYHLDYREVEGLVEIPISVGLSLFSDERSDATASGVEWNRENNKWDSISMRVTLKEFIPRIDPYYKKIFIMARLLLRGERYLSI